MSGGVENLSGDRKRELLAQLLQKKAAQAAAREARPPVELRAEPAGEAPAEGLVPAPQDWDRPFPLNDLQQAYLFGRESEVELGQGSIHVYVEFDSAGIDLERLERSFARLVERHGMLRAVPLPEGGQRILADLPPYRFERPDLSTASPAAVEAELAALRERMSHQLFEAGVWPPFEIRVCLLPAGRQTIHFSLDLLMIDASSFLLLFKDWGSYYEDPEAELPLLEISFRDYVLAEQVFRASEAARPSRDYWLRRVETLPPAPQLPLAADPASLGRPHFRRRTERLEPGLWRRLKEQAGEAGLTPSVFLCAAFCEVLAAWSKSPRFTLNMTRCSTACRLHPQVSDLVGDFTSLTLLEVDLTAGEALRGAALRLQERLWDDLDHRHFGGVRRAARAGAPARAGPAGADAGRLHQHPHPDFGGPGVDGGGPSSFITQTPQVWLDHQVIEERRRAGPPLGRGRGALPGRPAGRHVRRLRPPARAPRRGDRALARAGLAPAARASRLAVRAAVNATGAPVPEGLLHEPLPGAGGRAAGPPGGDLRVAER